MNKERIIHLTPNEVGHFVERASHCDFDIDVSNIHHGRRFPVDAKSLLGVLGLDFSNDLVVRYDGYDEAFESLLSQYAIAG